LKHDPAHVKAFASLVRQLKRKFIVTEPTPLDPSTQVVFSFLQWEATQNRADRAFGNIMAQVVDVNELRISFPRQIAAMIADPDYPLLDVRLGRMREALNEVYRREHDWQMRSIESKGKKDQRQYLDSLPGMTAYVAAHVTLVCFGGHALPVDRKLVALLSREGACEENADPAEVEQFILRQVKAGDAMQTHLLLQAWSDASRIVSPARKKPPAKKKTTKKKK